MDPPGAALLAAAKAALGADSLGALTVLLTGPESEPHRSNALIRYRRLVDVLGRLPGTGDSPGRVADFLSGDAVVLARMAAAVDVMEAAGIDGAATGRDDGYLQRAVYWQRYSCGPAGDLSDLSRRCAGDIARGSLRLWSRAGGVPQPVPGPPSRPIRAARAHLGVRIRRSCSLLRTDLGREATGLSRREVHGFDARVRGEAARVVAEIEEELNACAAVPAADAADLADCLPPRRRPRLENRLTTVLGSGFGVGVSFTVARMAVDLRPDLGPAASAGCVIPGLLATIWIVSTRRLLTERAAAERWVTEAVADLRSALEERVISALPATESGAITPRQVGF